ncbi:unnamed protein product [Aureobasidium pullulans]|nr:unnamed protein product [Aureobasidium pullulans]
MAPVHPYARFMYGNTQPYSQTQHPPSESDYLDQQHIGAVGVRPRVEVCRWNGCTIGPHRDRAEMRNHLQHHAPDARPWFCNGAAVQASSTATLAPHTIVCALTSKLSPNGTPVNSQHATTHPTTLGIT